MTPSTAARITTLHETRSGSRRGQVRSGRRMV
jgi:hypothetical protein